MAGSRSLPVDSSVSPLLSSNHAIAGLLINLRQLLVSPYINITALQFKHCTLALLCVFTSLHPPCNHIVSFATDPSRHQGDLGYTGVLIIGLPNQMHRSRDSSIIRYLQVSLNVVYLRVKIHLTPI
jgi:hypothetical protein